MEQSLALQQIQAFSRRQTSQKLMANKTTKWADRPNSHIRKVSYGEVPDLLS